MVRPIGIYEKATPTHFTWLERLNFAKELGFDFVEMSIDERDERLARLDWSKEERLEVVKAIYETGVRIPSICFSGHRRYPLGSKDPVLEEKSLELMKKCIELAQDLGVRTIQLAGYDVYYEEKSPQTRQRFIKNLRKACDWAEEAQVVLAIEIMDDPFISSIEKYLAIEKEIDSPFLFVYPDIGNVSAWHNDIYSEFYLGHHAIAALHLKDTYAVTESSRGQFRDVPLTDDDIAYLTIHIGGFLKYTPSSQKNMKKVYLVCDEGVAVSRLLLKQCKLYFPNEQIDTVFTTEQFKSVEDIAQVDVVITTNDDLDSRFPILRVNPILEAEDILKMLDYLKHNIFRNKSKSFSENLSSLISSYIVDSKLASKFQEEVQTLINQEIVVQAFLEDI